MALCKWICTRCRQLVFSLLSEYAGRKKKREEKELSTGRSSVTQRLQISLLSHAALPWHCAAVSTALSDAGLVRLTPASCTWATRGNFNSMHRLGVIICKRDGGVPGTFRLSCHLPLLTGANLLLSSFQDAPQCAQRLIHRAHNWPPWKPRRGTHVWRQQDVNGDDSASAGGIRLAACHWPRVVLACVVGKARY